MSARRRPPSSRRRGATTCSPPPCGFWRAWHAAPLVQEASALRAELAAAAGRGGDRGLLVAYLRSLADDHKRIVPCFQARSELTLLERVYVRLDLGGRLLERSGSAGDAEPLREMSLRDLLALSPADHPWITRRWVVVGDPGSGKTTLLRHLAATLAQEPEPRWVPVLASLPVLMREREWLLDRLARVLQRAGQPADALPAVLDKAGRDGRLLVLLDGLDEVPKQDRAEAEGLLRQLSTRWPETHIVVTTRPIGYEPFDAAFRDVEVRPLDEPRRREFLARWFGRVAGTVELARADEALGRLLVDRSLRELSGNPLYLTLMAILLEGGTEPDRNRTKLHDQVLDLLLEGRHRPDGEPMPCKDGVRAALRYLGLCMTHDNRDAEPPSALEARLYQLEADRLREPLERVPAWRGRMRSFLDELATRTAILGPHDGPDADWRYWHRTFREALAAEALARTPRKELLKLARDVRGDEGRWAEPFALICGHVVDPDALVKNLMRANDALGIRAIATAQGLRPETIRSVLALSDEWKERSKVYARVPELAGDPERAMLLLARLAEQTTDGNDLFFIDLALGAAAERWPAEASRAATLRVHLYDHLAKPPEELFTWIYTPHDRRVPLWADIPAGTFWMGSSEGVGHDDERPRHQVWITRAFQAAVVPVTNGQYGVFDPGYRARPRWGVPEGEPPSHPAVGITWYEATSSCRWLAARAPGAAGTRLPSEDEWEYMCRAGTDKRYWSGDAEKDLADVGWYDKNSNRRTHRVGEKRANPWGLNDVHGNVWEWTASEWTSDHSARKADVERDPSLPPSAGDPGAWRVIRGGGFGSGADDARAAYRDDVDPGVRSDYQGFRLVRPARAALDA